jgi:hypothetical protein
MKQRNQQLASAQEAEARATAKATALKDQLSALLAKSQPRPIRPADVSGIPSVTAKQIETFGGDLIGQRRQMACEFREISDAWVRQLLRDDSYVGLMVVDGKGTFFQYAFAKKDRYGKELVDLKRGTPIRLLGTVAKVGTRYVFLVDEIRR